MARSIRHLRQNSASPCTGLLVVNRHLVDHLGTGVWMPNVDLCESPDKVVIRVELPGVRVSDVAVSVQDGVVRIAGVKREPRIAREIVCYYCVERPRGRFEREIRINCVVDASRARASLGLGVLTLTFPRISERRGAAVSIRVTGEN